MALTWGTLIAGALFVFGLPIAVVSVNRWKRNRGWWLLAVVIALITVGNVAATL